MHTECGSQNGTESANERTLDAILARGRARRRRRHHVYAPDYCHGSVELRALHETFGPRWAESTAFVADVRDRGDRRLGWTVASFDDWFLEVDHLLESDGAEEAELAERLEGLGTVVALGVGRACDIDAAVADQRLIPVETTPERLLELERRYLGAVRQHDFRSESIQTHAEEVLLGSRLDVLSLVALCARLG